jgi:hypothetical protein
MEQRRCAGLLLGASHGARKSLEIVAAASREEEGALCKASAAPRELLRKGQREEGAIHGSSAAMQRRANLHACCRGEKKIGSRLKFSGLHGWSRPA